MHVSKFFVCQSTFDNAERYDAFQTNEFPQEVYDIVTESILWNCDARIEMADDALHTPVGNGTECGLIKFLMYNSIDAVEKIKEKTGKTRHITPFDSFKKRMLTCIEHPTLESTVRVYLKGAPEQVLPRCTSYISADGGMAELESSEQKEWLEDHILGDYAEKGLRTIALAYKDMDAEQFFKMQEESNFFEDEDARAELESDMGFVIAFGLLDELREGATKSIMQAMKGQINVRMISGDNMLTARACAIKVGILSADEADQEYVCMTGDEFRNAVGGLEKADEKCKVNDMEVFKHVANRLRVLSRATPDDKHAFITGLKQLGCVVAVTGDGINDVGALRASNVGFAMGTGCETAKDASDMILMDDNFSSTISAVLWGRNIFDNIRKFL